MIIFDTVPASMIDPIVDEILKSSKTQFQELDSRVFISLVLSGREISVERLWEKQTWGCGSGKGSGLGYTCKGSGFGAGISSGRGQQNYFGNGEGKEKFHKYSFGWSYGEGDTLGNGGFPLNIILDQEEYDHFRHY